MFHGYVLKLFELTSEMGMGHTHLDDLNQHDATRRR